MQKSNPNSLCGMVMKIAYNFRMDLERRKINGGEQEIIWM